MADNVFTGDTRNIELLSTLHEQLRQLEITNGRLRKDAEDKLREIADIERIRKNEKFKHEKKVRHVNETIVDAKLKGKLKLENYSERRQSLAMTIADYDTLRFENESLTIRLKTLQADKLAKDKAYNIDIINQNSSLVKLKMDEILRSTISNFTNESKMKSMNALRQEIYETQIGLLQRANILKTQEQTIQNVINDQNKHQEKYQMTKINKSLTSSAIEESVVRIDELYREINHYNKLKNKILLQIQEYDDKNTTLLAENTHFISLQQQSKDLTQEIRKIEKSTISIQDKVMILVEEYMRQCLYTANTWYVQNDNRIQIQSSEHNDFSHQYNSLKDPTTTTTTTTRVQQEETKTNTSSVVVDWNNLDYTLIWKDTSSS